MATTALKPVKTITAKSHEELVKKVAALPTKPIGTGCQLVRNGRTGEVRCLGTCPGRIPQLCHVSTFVIGGHITYSCVCGPVDAN